MTRVLRPNFREILDEFYPHVEGKAWSDLSKTLKTKILNGIDAAFVTMPAPRFPSEVQLLGRGNILTGLNEKTIVHEFLHVATSYRIGAGIYGVGPEADKARKIIDEMIDIRDKALTYVNKKLKENPDYFGDNSAVFRDYVLRFKKRRTDANRGRIVDEMISYAFTDPDFQRLLSEVPMGENKTGFSEFVRTILELIGFGPKDSNALSRVIRLSDELLETDIAAVSTWVKDFGEGLGENAEDIFAAINLTLTRPADRLRQNLVDGILTTAADGTVTSRLGEFVDPEVVSRGPRFVRGEADPQLREDKAMLPPPVKDFVRRSGNVRFGFAYSPGAPPFGATPRKLADPPPVSHPLSLFRSVPRPLKGDERTLPPVSEWLERGDTSIWTLNAPIDTSVTGPLARLRQAQSEHAVHSLPWSLDEVHAAERLVKEEQARLIEQLKTGELTFQLRPDKLWERLEMLRALRLDFADLYYPQGSVGRDKVLKAIDDFYVEERALIIEAGSIGDVSMVGKLDRQHAVAVALRDRDSRLALEKVSEKFLNFLAEQSKKRLAGAEAGFLKVLGSSPKLVDEVVATLRRVSAAALRPPHLPHEVTTFLDSAVSPEQFSANIKLLWGESFAQDLSHLRRKLGSLGLGQTVEVSGIDPAELEAARDKLNRMYDSLRDSLLGDSGWFGRTTPIHPAQPMSDTVSALNRNAVEIGYVVSQAKALPVESIAGGYYELDRATDLAGMERLAQEINDLPWFHGSPQRTVKQADGTPATYTSDDGVELPVLLTLRDYEIQYSGTGSGNMLGAGLYLTSDPERALTYARRIYGEGAGVVKSVGLNARKVLDLRGSAEDLIKQLREAGLAEDSIILRHIEELKQLHAPGGGSALKAWGVNRSTPSTEALEELLNAGIDGVHHRGAFDKDVLVLFDPNANSLDGAAPSSSKMAVQ